MTPTVGEKPSSTWRALLYFPLILQNVSAQPESALIVHELLKWNHIEEHERADRGDQHANMFSLTPGEVDSGKRKQEEHQQLFNASFRVRAAAVDRLVFSVQKELKHEENPWKQKKNHLTLLL